MRRIRTGKTEPEPPPTGVIVPFFGAARRNWLLAAAAFGGLLFTYLPFVPALFPRPAPTVDQKDPELANAMDAMSEAASSSAAPVGGELGNGSAAAPPPARRPAPRRQAARSKSVSRPRKAADVAPQAATQGSDTVKAIQTEAGLAADGVLGPQTCAAIVAKFRATGERSRQLDACLPDPAPSKSKAFTPPQSR